MKLLALDFGGTAIKYGIWENKELTKIDSVPTPQTWEEMCAVLANLKEQQTDITGVAISSPGAVDSVKGIIGGVSAIPYIHQFPIVKAFEELFNVPVTIENDANCAALAELQYGAAKDSQSTVFFIIGSGIGGAISVDGQLIKGNHLFGGEFGYMMMDEHDNLSRLTSPVQWAQAYSKEYQLSTELSGKALFDLADQGEETAKAAVQKWYETLARGMFNVCLILDPQQILIGGGISSRSEILAPIKKELAILLEKNGAQELTVDVQFCQFKQQANLLGAIANFERTKLGVR